jgi:uncharacterized protein
MRLTISVKPNAKSTSAAVAPDGTLTLRIAAPPVDGKANDAVVALLSKLFNVPKSRIAVVKGHSSRLKQVEINGNEDEIRHVIASLAD